MAPNLQKINKVSSEMPSLLPVSMIMITQYKKCYFFQHFLTYGRKMEQEQHKKIQFLQMQLNV